MTILNLKSYIEGLWDWGFLDKCFGSTKIRVSDIDGMVERNGHLLMIEAKGPGKKLPRGQQIAFQELVKNPGISILIIWGDKNNPEQAYLRRHDGYISAPSATERDVVDIVTWWFSCASRNEFRRNSIIDGNEAFDICVAY